LKEVKEERDAQNKLQEEKADKKKVTNEVINYFLITYNND